MNKQDVLKWLSLAGKGLSLLTGLAAWANYIPPKYAALAILAFGIASILKDTVNRIGDLVDDGIANNSFKSLLLVGLFGAGALSFVGCGTPSLVSFNIPAAIKEAGAAREVADAGSTVGVAKAISTSPTLSNAVASAKVPSGTSTGEKVAAGMVTAGKALADPTTVQVIGAGVQAGAGAAGVEDPSKMASLAQAAAAGVGGMLTLLGAGVGAWLHRKGTQAASPTPPPPAPTS